MSEEQYSDPSSEAIQRIAQAALPLATLADVAARLAAATHDEQTIRSRRRLTELHRQRAADRAAAAAIYGPALNTRWLATAGLADLGAAWRAGHANADSDPRAAHAAARVEMRLRQLHPPAMRHYDRRREAGLTPAAAMAEAARIMAFVDPTAHPRPAGRTRPALHATVKPDVAADHAAAAAYTPGLNNHWLSNAGIFDLGQVWQAAHRHAATDTRASAAADRVEEQLRRLHPPAMRRYDDLRTAGYTPFEAMAEAAAYFARIDPTARPGQAPPARRQLEEASAAGAELIISTVRPREPNPHSTQSALPHGNAATAAGDPDATSESADPAAAPVGGARPVFQVVESSAPPSETAATVLRACMFPHPLPAELDAARRELAAEPVPSHSPIPTAMPSAACRRQR